MTAIDIYCPVCDAAPGDDCLPAGRTHQSRFDAAARINGGIQQSGRDRMLGLWRSAVQAVTAAADAASEAEGRTAAIEPAPVPSAVVGEEPTFVFPKERGKC